ncbi:hypothetical protein Ccrd_014940 [Cynara cardunculus var. scolymus]|uniref:Uncharacterized protein n=2 Tax=Cynara cardunculus var. scolymus TaxID=59895 RepID=A0A118K3Y8_CYNCS|nr:hypothetical protein Ccrd_014940 [Cynara cardunculus var. scolymus]
MELLMEEEELKVDGLSMGDFHSNQKENFELASDFNATDDKNNGFTQENQAEDSNAEEEYDDEEDEDAEETYSLRFKGETNPLALTEDDAFGVQAYECLEQPGHEYEALAAKKRKESLNYNHLGMPPVKKLRQEDYPGPSFEDLLAIITHGKRRK